LGHSGEVQQIRPNVGAATDGSHRERVRRADQGIGTCPDGVRLSKEAVADAALLAARDCMANDLRSGWLDLKYRIDVQNENGGIVYTMQFADAVEIRPT
jgi:hypothetical protein